MNQQVLNVRLVNNAVLGSTEDSVGAHTVIGLLKQLYEKLRTSTGNTSINIGIIQGAIRALENTVNGSIEVEPPIVGLTTQVANINTEINGTNGLRSQISTIETVNNTQNSEITSLKSRATSIEETNQQQTVKINDNEDDITALTTRVNAIDNSNDGRLTVVERSVANLVSEVEGQDGALDDIIQLQADVGTLQQTINNLPPAGVGESTNNLGGERFNLYSNGNPVRNDASGDYSHAEGYLTVAFGNYSHVEGASNTSSGEGSHAEGEQTTASGTASHTEGYRTSATGLYAHAEGYTNSPTNYLASGQGSHVEGYNTKATNTACHAEGSSTSASGLYAHAEGCNTTANGYYSHAGGYYTTARGQCMTAVGNYNTYTSDLTTTTNRLFVVGNGSSTTNRSDAFIVSNNGSVVINSTRSGTTPSLQIGTSKAITGTTAASSSQAFEDDVLITKYYANNDLMTIFMNIAYPVDSIYFSHNVIDLYDDQGNLSSTGKPLTPTRGPLDFGTWYRINWDCDNYYCIGLLPKSAASSSHMTGNKKLSIFHLPAHAHKGIWTPDGYRPTGTGGNACVPAITVGGNNPRFNDTAVIPNSLGDSSDGTSYFDLASSQRNIQPYGYYCYMYRKVSLS